ncbi:MAG TPA: methylmalonyl Co-A mutase-associated GTPase MeaB [Terriglobales bacterium]|jgi:LAO/AO transport system kinase|nr:methylmalonyl Co-A mutase-associated GTPase MeaB [Terriglobales bacterium]
MFRPLLLLYTGAVLNPNGSNLISAVRSGEPRALARAISAVENHSPGWIGLLKELFPHTGNALTMGLTGSPGAGKSTLVDQLAKFFRKTKNPRSREGRDLNGRPSSGPNGTRDDRYTVGIIAVDPTSPYTGGAILGDRIRMQDHFSDPGIYIRSMATRGSLGGLSRATADVSLVLDASGRDIVMIETVGVGQDEVDIVRVADITIVILSPGMGDEIQAMKAGLMEIADIFVINKSDHEGSERVEKEIRALQSLAIRDDGWVPPVVKTVAPSGAGVEELAQAISSYQEYLASKDLLRPKRAQNWETRLVEMLRDALLERARASLSTEELSRISAEIAEHKRDPYSVVEELMNMVRE